MWCANCTLIFGHARLTVKRPLVTNLELIFQFAQNFIETGGIRGEGVRFGIAAVPMRTEQTR